MEFGSGSALLGGDAGQALNEAIARRQTGQTGALQQTTPNAPTFNPETQAPTPAPASSVSGLGSPPSSTPSAGVGAGLPAESSEAMVIIKALAQRLKQLPPTI